MGIGKLLDPYDGGQDRAISAGSIPQWPSGRETGADIRCDQPSDADGLRLLPVAELARMPAAGGIVIGRAVAELARMPAAGGIVIGRAQPTGVTVG
jgi:hypothetical protein